MAAPMSLADLLDSLPNFEDSSSLLEQVYTIVSSSSASRLKDVVRNVSFNVMFDLLDADKSELVELTCKVLELLLEAVEVTELLAQYEEQLIGGLGHRDSTVRQLCLTQASRCSNDCPQQLLQSRSAIRQVITLLADDCSDVAKQAAFVLVGLGGTAAGPEVLFGNRMHQAFNTVMARSDITAYRVFEVAIDVARQSEGAMQCCAECGLLEQLLNDLDKDDILVQLNCVELLRRLALSAPGLCFLRQQGVVDRLGALLACTQSQPLMALLAPGLVKFFGNIAHLHPKETCDSTPTFLPIVFSMLDSGDMNAGTLATETLGFIGSTVEGKHLLEKNGIQMRSACQRMGYLMRDAPSACRCRILDAVAELLTLSVADQTSELLLLVQSWFCHLSAPPLDSLSLLLTLAQQPFPDGHSAVLRILLAIVTQPWAQQLLAAHPTAKEYLLDRGTETEKLGKEEKYAVILALSDSPTVVDKLGRVYVMKLREYVQDGPFYVHVQAAVAMESG